MSQLEFPLKEGLRDPADEGAVSRMWQGIDARFPRRRARPIADAFLATERRAWPPPRASRWWRSCATMPDRCGWRTATRSSPSTRRRRARGWRCRTVPASISRAARASSRSNRRRRRSSRCWKRGAASFEVRPGGPRRWQIECGLATVEVVGTRFTCARGADRLHIGVEHGVVLVRGERVPNRVRRLAAGESLDVLDRATGGGARRRQRRPHRQRAGAETAAPSRRPARATGARRRRRHPAPVRAGASSPATGSTARRSRRWARRASGAKRSAWASPTCSRSPTWRACRATRPRRWGRSSASSTAFPPIRRRRWPRSRSAAWSSTISTSRRPRPRRSAARWSWARRTASATTFAPGSKRRKRVMRPEPVE